MLLSRRGFYTNSCLVHINYDDIFPHGFLNGHFFMFYFYSILFYSISSSISSSAVVMYQRYFLNISRTVHEELNALDCLWNFDYPETNAKGFKWDKQGCSMNPLRI